MSRSMTWGTEDRLSFRVLLVAKYATDPRRPSMAPHGAGLQGRKETEGNARGFVRRWWGMVAQVLPVEHVFDERETHKG